MEINPNFKSIPYKEGERLIDLQPEIVKGLSTDANLSFCLSQIASTGVMTDELAQMMAGKVCHARWLTIAEKFLEMWLRHQGFEGELLDRLEIIVSFIVRVYFKLFFDIKVKHLWTQGPYHILTELRLMRDQPEVVQTI